MSESKILEEFNDLHKSFGPLKVMDGLDFTLSQGENVAILGQSGTGKSVLLKVIIGPVSYTHLTLPTNREV